jgi:DNA mismatch repair protein MutS2
MNLVALEYPILLNQIIEHSAFSLGRKQLENLQPSSSVLWIERENQRVQAAMTSMRLYGSCPMVGMRDLRSVLENIAKDATAGIEALVELAQMIRGIHSAHQYYVKQDQKDSVLGDLFLSLYFDEKQAKAIEQAFSVEFEVYDHASSTLKSIRQQLRQSYAERDRVAHQFIQSHSSKLTEPIASLRQDRVVVLVKQSEKNSFGGLIHGSSASGQSAYVEPPVLLAINNKILSLIEDEQSEIERICFELSQIIKPDAMRYIDALETMGLLDSLFARASYGVKMDAITGKLSSELFLKAARHPLIDPKLVVANTYRLKQDKQVLLITGPNTGGKTVSLKLIGLFALCIYSGIPVCANEAHCPLYDEIYVDIGDQQSIAQSLSTFSAHISNLAEITAQASKHSLVLLDELGSSTDPQEGESLAMAILDELRAKGASVIATTHFSKLKAYALSHEDIQIASVQFDLQKMQPTFKFLEGVAGQSYALEIAARYQLKPSILAAAQVYKDTAKTEQEKLQEKLDRQAIELQQLQDQLLDQQVQLDQKIQALNQREASFDKTLELKRQKVEQEVQNLYEEAEQEADEILKSLREQKPNEGYHQALEKKKQLQKKSAQPKAQLDIQSLKKGQAVRLLQTNQLGQVIEIKKKVVVVMINGIRMEVPPHQLALADFVETKKHVHIVSEPVQFVPYELNIIGLHVEEAIEMVDKYLDDCLRARMPMARIVHGHGTGALREAVHQKLRKQTGVKAFRLGAQGEGGAGATVITFISSTS